MGEIDSDAKIGVAENLQAGVLTSLRVVAKNDVATQYGAVSDTIKLTPAALPGPSSLISVAEYGENYLLLSWAVPADTGAGNQALVIQSYEL